MNGIDNIPAWVALLTAVLVLLGAGLTLVGSFGLVRLDTFYARVHAPTLGTTLGAGSILIASMLFFSMLQTRVVLHEILITVFVTLTTPVTFMLLTRAALLRERVIDSSAPADRDAEAESDNPPE